MRSGKSARPDGSDPLPLKSRKKRKMILLSQFAKKHKKPYQTVMAWRRDGLLHGVVKIEKPFVYYLIPENAPLPSPRKPGPKPAKKSAKKK